MGTQQQGIWPRPHAFSGIRFHPRRRKIFHGQPDVPGDDAVKMALILRAIALLDHAETDVSQIFFTTSIN